MIVRMKRLRLFLFHSEKDRILRLLQRNGTVDIRASVTANTGIAEKIAELDKENNALKEIERAAASAPAAQTAASRHANIAGMLREAQRIMGANEQLLNAIRELNAQLAEYAPWVEIPIDTIAALKQHGIGVHLFSGSVGLFSQFDFSRHDVLEVSRSGNTVRFMLITFQADAPIWPFQKHTIPASSVEEMRTEIAQLERQLRTNMTQLSAFAGRAVAIREYLAAKATRLDFVNARNRLEKHDTGTIHYLTGFFPAKQLAKMQGLLERERLAYTIDDPPGDDPAPVALRNARVFSFFEPITRIFSLPAYSELDPTPLFAPFFALFFGFCFGDVGYGLLLLALSISGFFTSARAYAPLGVILSLSTILSGVLMNSFFGAALFGQGQEALMTTSGNPAIFAAYTVKGKTVFPAMPLSLALGAFQVLVAFCFQAVNAALSLGIRYIWKSLGQLALMLGCTILAVHSDFLNLGFNRSFTIGPLPLGEWLSAMTPRAGLIFLASGLVAFFIFGNPDRKFPVRPLAALWDFYGFATGLLGDLLSYIRLFALALAGGLLGNAFNQIAFMVLPKHDDTIIYASPWIIACALILVIGHGLNFALGLLGAFVHPLRLTFVEFYKNINFRGGGKAYAPFRRHTTLKSV